MRRDYSNRGKRTPTSRVLLRRHAGWSLHVSEAEEKYLFLRFLYR